MLLSRRSVADCSICLVTTESSCSGADVSKIGRTRERARLMISSIDTGRGMGCIGGGKGPTLSCGGRQ